MNKILIGFACMLTIIACNETKKMNTPESETIAPAADTVKPLAADTVKPISITGKVQEIQNGKDGYTAKVNTAENEIYFATISIPNMKDPKDYKRVAVGDSINITGEFWKTETESHITVRSMK